MDYQAIKLELAAARQLLDAGDVAAADKKIRAMAGKGLTRADLDANLTAAQIKMLRDHARQS